MARSSVMIQKQKVWVQFPQRDTVSQNMIMLAKFLVHYYNMSQILWTASDDRDRSVL